MRSLPTWRPGDPNSWTPQLQSSIDTFLDEVADQDPQAVLVPGDLVEGHWTKDVDRTGIFGPSGTTRQGADGAPGRQLLRLGPPPALRRP